MDDFKPPPMLFANHVIRQMADHMLGQGLLLAAKDYLVVRTAFRSMGGLWDAVGDGDIAHLDKLKNVVTAWAAEAQPKSEGDEVI